MTVFEYVLTFLTVVLGLGLTRNLTAIAEMRFRENREQNLLDIAWLVSVTLMQIDFWFGLWYHKRSQETWPLWELLLYVAVATSLYMAGAYFARSLLSADDDRQRARSLGIVSLLAWMALATGNAIFVLEMAWVAIPGTIASIVLVVALVSAKRLSVFRAATLGFLVWAVYLVGFAGPTTLSS